MNLLLSISLAVIALKVDFVKADCGVISKKDWGSLKVERVVYLARPIEVVVILDTRTRNCVPGNYVSCVDIIKNIQTEQMTVHNYTDIGFSFIVGGDLKVYEGTGWLHVGNHTLGYNSISIGIAFVGTYDYDVPSTRMLKITKDFLKCGVDSGHLTPDYQIVAYSQLLDIDIPGKNLYDEIKTWPQWERDVTYIKFKAHGTRYA